jgi:hypothetical protein
MTASLRNCNSTGQKSQSRYRNRPSVRVRQISRAEPTKDPNTDEGKYEVASIVARAYSASCF